VQVRCGLESPDSGTYQQRVGHMRLLGEMYNFRLVDSRYTSEGAFHCAFHCCVLHHTCLCICRVMLELASNSSQHLSLCAAAQCVGVMVDVQALHAVMVHCKISSISQRNTGAAFTYSQDSQHT
jgi:hypothetical protein